MVMSGWREGGVGVLLAYRPRSSCWPCLLGLDGLLG